MKTNVWIKPENISKYAWRMANGIGAKNVSFQPAGAKEKIICDKSLNADSTIVKRAQPAIALPNKRRVSDKRGAHIEIKLIGKKIGIGSI